MSAEFTPNEISILNWLLPADRPYYAQVGQCIMSLPGKRSDDGLEFGLFDEGGAETVAIGQAESGPASLLLNDDRKGAKLYLPATDDLIPVWTLSSWQPGSKFYRGRVREIPLGGPSPICTLALSPEERVLWLHHWKDGYNQLLPITGVLVELARLVRPTDRGRPSREAFFTLAASADDVALGRALLEYNKRARKFDAKDIVIQEKAGSSRLFDFFSKRR